MSSSLGRSSKCLDVDESVSNRALQICNLHASLAVREELFIDYVRTVSEFSPLLSRARDFVNIRYVLLTNWVELMSKDSCEHSI